MVMLGGCAAGSGATQTDSTMPPTSSYGNAPASLSQALLRMEELPGRWELEGMAPDPATAATDPAARMVNQCLRIPDAAQPNRDRSTFSMYFAQSPKTERSLIVNSSATAFPGATEARALAATMGSLEARTCLEAPVRQNAIEQYAAVGYDVRNAAVEITTLAEFQKEHTAAYRSEITVTLQDDRELRYYIDSFALAPGTVYVTLTVFREAEPPPPEMEVTMLRILRKRAELAGDELAGLPTG
jgi:hypothetical protein